MKKNKDEDKEQMVHVEEDCDEYREKKTIKKIREGRKRSIRL